MQANGVLDQLGRYFEISKACLNELDDAVKNAGGGWVEEICPSVDSDSESSNSIEIDEVSCINIKIKTENIFPNKKPNVPEVSLKKRRASDSLSDPMEKMRTKMQLLEKEIQHKQKPIKKRIHKQIGDICDTIEALHKQSQLLQIAEDGQQKREQMISDGETIQKNLQKNSEKIIKHIKKSKIRKEKKTEQINGLKEHTDAEIKDVKHKTKKLKDAAAKTKRKVINPEIKRIKEQSRLLKTETQAIDKELRKLLLSPADKRAVYGSCARAIAAFQSGADAGGIAEKPMKIAICVIKCVLSIGITILDGGSTFSLVTSSIQDLLDACSEVLEILQDHNESENINSDAEEVAA